MPGLRSRLVVWTLAAALGIFAAGTLGCGGGNPVPGPEVVAVVPDQPAPAPPTDEATAPSPPPRASSPESSAASVEAVPADLLNKFPWLGQAGNEPFDVQQYLLSRAEPAENAAPLYQTALAAFDANAGDESAKALAGEIAALSQLGALVGPAAPQERVADVLNKARAAVQQIDLAQAKPQCVFPNDFELQVAAPHAQAAATVARLALLQLYQARERADMALALSAIRRALRMSRDLQPRAAAISQLISMSIDSGVLGGVEAITLHDPALTAEQCDEIDKLLLEHQQNSLNRLEEALKVQYITTRKLLDDLQSGRMTPEKMVDMMAPGMSATMPKRQAMGTPDFKAMLPALDRAVATALAEAKGPYKVQEKLDMAKLVADAQAAAASGKGVEAQLAGMTAMMSASLAAIRDADFRARAHLAGVEMVVALKRYQLVHPELPKDLEVAAAESALKTVPIDPYAGQPLRYAVIEGKPVIYSVGKDLQDDRGLVDWKSSTQPGDFLFVLTPPRATAATGKAATPLDKASVARAPAKPRAKAKKTAPNAAPGERALAGEASAPGEAAATGAAAPAAGDPEYRMWTSTAGTSLEAALAAVDGGAIAVLKKRDGSEVRVPLSKLSKFDQQWVKNNAP